MNPFWFLKNVKRAFRICDRWSDRFQMLLWVYSGTLPRWLSPPSRTIVCRYPAPVGRINVTVRSNNGSDAFVFSEVFEQRYYNFDLPETPRTILDAGANVGFATLFFARKYPEAEIASVEPMPDNIPLLRANISNNRLSARVIAKALTVTDAPVVMQISDRDYGHKVAQNPFGRILKGGAQEVMGVSVRTLMAELGWSNIGLLKIDIEGYEAILLREDCDWLEYVNALCIECHEGFSEQDLNVVARNHGFLPPRVLAGVSLLVRNRKNVSATNGA